MRFRPLVFTLSLLLLGVHRLLAGGSDAGFVTSLESGQRQKIVVYGTSLTANAAWPAEFQKVLRHSFGRKCEVVNAGKGGMDSRWGVANLEKRVIRERPDVVFVEFSINDALESSKLSVRESVANLEAMVATIRRELPSCEIIVQVMNPPTGEQLKKRIRIRDYEMGCREVARRRGCRLIDHASVWRTLIKREPERWKCYVPDGIHPNSAACREVILPTLLRKIGLGELAGKTTSGW